MLHSYEALSSFLLLTSFVPVIMATSVLGLGRPKLKPFVVLLPASSPHGHAELQAMFPGQSLHVNSWIDDQIKSFYMLLTEEHARLLRDARNYTVEYARDAYLLTTRTWTFMGGVDAMHGPWATPPVDTAASLWSKTNFGSDVIIGVIDSGYWPYARAFRDDGMPPVPKRWNGICESGESFPRTTCNRKVIGARFLKDQRLLVHSYLGFNIEPAVYNSPLDDNGHGTHVASTLGGRNDINVEAFAPGEAWGGAPFSRLAIYKACWRDRVPPCNFGDLNNAFTHAVDDGVDVLSVSLGSPDHMMNAVALGGLRAVNNGIPVVAAAGNDGPAGPVMNAQPWLLTVGASTIDRDFEATMLLSNQWGLTVTSICRHATWPKSFFSIDTEELTYDPKTSFWGRNCSIPSIGMRDKIVFCHNNDDATTLAMAVYSAFTLGAVAVVLPLSPLIQRSFQESDKPVFYIDSEALADYNSYLTSTRQPSGKFLEIKTAVNLPAPKVAVFSSRGPREGCDYIKPDIIAPGVDILAAAPFENFTLKSGTSMATPHVAAVVAMLKLMYPDWSPAMIKSAIMTTASPTDSGGEPIKDYNGERASPYVMGAGFINPSKAMDPGLVLDIEVQYLNSKIGNDMVRPDLNYPSILVRLSGARQVSVKRTFTIVPPATSTVVYYFNKTDVPPAVAVYADDFLMFTKRHQTVSDELLFFLTEPSHVRATHFGSVSWSDGEHNVRIPFVVEVLEK